MSDSTNWHQSRMLLIDRIRRRYLALQRLTSSPVETGALEQEIESCGDDAGSLWALAERIDRALDLALAPRATRASVCDAPVLQRHDEFKS